MLLLGYVYAHLLSRTADMRKQIATHTFVLLLPLAFLPIQFNAASSQSFSLHPSLELLLVLLTSTAIPFFVVSTTAPLLQNWFSRTTHAASSDPYFLYTASNAGSLLALLSYPFLVEPRIGAATQSRLWRAGYVGLIVMFALTAAALYSKRQVVIDHPDRTESVGHRKRLYWIAASMVPSALMLAVTNHIAANVGSVPFLWLVPLALYLLTFILAFGRVRSERVSRITPLALLLFFPFVAAGVMGPPGLNWILIGIHLLLMFVGCLLCHTRLAESRPEPQHLTEFYFWVALGGVLGGAFTATIAPAVFNSVFEYPLLVAILPFFLGGALKKSDIFIAAGIAVVTFVAWTILRATHLDSDTNAIALTHMAVFFTGYKFSRNPPRFACAFVVFMFAYAFIIPGYIEGANRIFTSRNFFGVKKVLDNPNTHLRQLRHGDTIHGMESTEPERAAQPLSYYYPGGSVSDVVEMLRRRGSSQRFAVLGLGTGTMGSYSDSSQQVTFYEIDPAVEAIARQYFTFLRRCDGNCSVVIGDGRLQLAREPDSTFDLLLLDAFSSDSIPAHLLSREAVQMYLAKLKPGGVLLFNVSNRYLNVEKLVSALVADAGLVGFARFDDAGDLKPLGKSSANHLAAARRLEDIRELSGRPGWYPITRPANFESWTDDYSTLLGLIRWH
jgi:SAM-dependent methyltransferase